MAENFGLEIKGDQRAILRFEQFPAAAHDRLLTTLRQIEQRLESAVKSAEPMRSGMLYSETGGTVYDHGNRIAAVVGVRAKGTEAAKAGALEWGAHRGVTVKAHAMGLDHFWSRLVSRRIVSVPDYNRIPNIAEVRFLRGPIEAMREEFIAEMRAALDAAVKDGDQAP